MSLAVGMRIGSYDILSSLGAGGMGEVYRARDTKLNRDVAIKILPDAFASDGDRVARFTREAQTLATLNHPHIAQIHGLEESSGVRALVMELVEGEDLAQRIARGLASPKPSGEGGPIPIDEALAIARQIAEGLEAAHEKGIIHRDLKPANIKLTADGAVKILDFGLAKAVDQAASIDVENSPTFTVAATQMGVILGTAAYMSPEQARGKPVDRRSDLWALGCVLYEMLAGRRAFEGETVSDLVAAVIGREPDWSILPSSCPSAIRRLLRRCLEKDRTRRLDSASVARLEIEEALSVQPSDEDHVTPRRRWTSPLIPWVVAAVAVAAGGWQWFTTRPEGRTSAAATPFRFSITLPAGITLNPAYPALALSPDGRSLIVGIVDRQSGQSKLAIRRADALGLETIPGTENGSRPFFLPDGRRVGFVTGRQLCVIEATGGVARVITALDARRFAGGSSAPDDTIVFADQTNAAQWGLKRVKLSGGPIATFGVPDAGNGETAFLWPQVLPDNEHVLVTVRHSGEQYSVETISLATGARHRVLDDAFAGQYSASGHVVFFRSSARETNGTVGELMAAPFDMKRLAVQGEAASLVTGVRSATFNQVPGVNFAMSPNTLIVVPSRSPGNVWPLSSLAWVDRRGTVERVPAVPQPYRHLSLSPDGTRVAAGVDGVNRDVWIHDLVRGVPSRFTTAPEEDETPHWSPDGKRLAWGTSRDHKETLLIASADGSSPEERVWPREEHVHVNGWSPDGQMLYVTTATGPANDDRDLWTFSLRERAATPFVQTRAREFGAAPSPDGRWVAYVSDASGHDEVYVRGVRDAARMQISREGGREPVWAPDGRELFYRSLDSTKILSVSVAGTTELQAGAPTVALNLAFPSGGIDPAYAVSRDGKRFLVMLEEKNPDVGAQTIDVTVNWLARRKP